MKIPIEDFTYVTLVSEDIDDNDDLDDHDDHDDHDDLDEGSISGPITSSDARQLPSLEDFEIKAGFNPSQITLAQGG